MADRPTIAVIATLDSKAEAALYTCERVREAGGEPWLMDMSLRPHEVAGADASPAAFLARAGTSWEELGGMQRTAATEAMIAAGAAFLRDKVAAGEIMGALGMGGANGCAVFCGMVRPLPPLFPKVAVTPVAATAAVQWYVAESDIAMYPTIGDVLLNRIVRAILENAAHAVTGMARAHQARRGRAEPSPPLVGLSTFGGVQPTVDRITERLEAAGMEIMHFHASGPGGKALENLAGAGEFTGVIDLTTSEMADLLTDGVYKPNDDRLTQAGAAGIPQVIAPGCLDHTNWWVGQCPEGYRHRAFHQYNQQNLLMRTDADEMEKLAEMFAERLNAAKGPVVVLIPTRGFSQHTVRDTTDLEGKVIGKWHQPETDRRFTETLKKRLRVGEIKELDLHINDQEFADACVEEFLEMLR